MPFIVAAIIQIQCAKSLVSAQEEIPLVIVSIWDILFSVAMLLVFIPVTDIPIPIKLDINSLAMRPAIFYEPLKNFASKTYLINVSTCVDYAAQ